MLNVSFSSLLTYLAALVMHAPRHVDVVTVVHRHHRHPQRQLGRPLVRQALPRRHVRPAVNDVD